MKKLAFALALCPSLAWAQGPAPTSIDYYKQTVGNCVAESANLFEQANKFAAEAQQLRAKIVELEKKLGDKPETESKPNRPTGRPGGMPQ